MANQNQVNITGRLGQDAEFKAFSNGGGVCNFSVAVSETWTDKNSGQRQEKTEWIPVAMFSKGAEKLTQYLTKGTQVRVCGKFKTRSWENNGSKQYRTEVVVDGFGTEVELLGSPSGQAPNNQNSRPAQNGGYQNNQQGYQQPQQNGNHQQPMQTPAMNGGGAVDDDIPFTKHFDGVM